MKLLIVSTLIATTAVFAGKNLEERKARLLKNLDQRISSLNDLKSCISSASDGKAIKSCHAKRKEVMKAQRAKMKEYRESMKAKRKARKENKQ